MLVISVFVLFCHPIGLGYQDVFFYFLAALQHLFSKVLVPCPLWVTAKGAGRVLAKGLPAQINCLPLHPEKAKIGEKEATVGARCKLFDVRLLFALSSL